MGTQFKELPDKHLLAFMIFGHHKSSVVLEIPQPLLPNIRAPQSKPVTPEAITKTAKGSEKGKFHILSTSKAQESTSTELGTSSGHLPNDSLKQKS